MSPPKHTDTQPLTLTVWLPFQDVPLNPLILRYCLTQIGLLLHTYARTYNRMQTISSLQAYPGSDHWHTQLKHYTTCKHACMNTCPFLVWLHRHFTTSNWAYNLCGSKLHTNTSTQHNHTPAQQRRGACSHLEKASPMLLDSSHNCQSLREHTPPTQWAQTRRTHNATYTMSNCVQMLSTHMLFIANC